MKIYVHTLLEESLQKRFSQSLPEASIIYRTMSADDEMLKSAFQGANIILGNPPIAWFEKYDSTSHVFWQLDSAGFDQYKSVEVPVKVSNMGDWFAMPCAETIIAGILALYRGLDQLVLLQNENKWVGAPIRENLHLLSRKKTVVLGAGTIGDAVAGILRGFGVEPIIVARTSEKAHIHTKEELLPVLSTTDLVINTLPGVAGQYVDESFLEAMKVGSVYANVGRGSTTDEITLIRLLKNKHLGGAVLDVTAVEPLPAESDLWNLPQVILLQHTGGGTSDEAEGKVDLFLKNYQRISKGEEPLHQVSLKRGY